MRTKNAYKEGKRVELDPIFREKLFNQLFVKCPTSLLIEKFDISRGMLYHYKNGRVETIPIALLEKLCKIINISDIELEKNTIKTISSKNLRKKGLEIGRIIRKDKLNILKEKIPTIDEIIKNNYLDVEKWFNSYIGLLESGFKRKIKRIEKEGNRLKITYIGHSKGVEKTFSNYLPSKIKLDEDFKYFFGLWCGDKVGGGRIGVANKSLELNLFTEKYLKKIYQEPKFVMLKSSNVDKLPKIGVRIDETIEIKNMPGDFVICVSSVNGILKTFFNYLAKNLDIFLDLLPEKNIFFAGLFDAEGNVFLEDQCFRWACKNKEQVEIYKRKLKKYELFDRYDGSSLVTNNIEAFSRLIFPFIKHKQKINKTSLIVHGKGYLDDRFKRIIDIIKRYPGKTQDELTKIIEKKKLYAQLKFLSNLNYIQHKGYPKRFYIANKGLREVKNDNTDQMS